MKSGLTLLLLLLIFDFSTRAQDGSDRKIKSISLSGGVGHISLSDKLLTPLIYRGSGFIWDLQLSNHSVKRKHDIIFNHGSSTLSPKLNDISRNTTDNSTSFFHYQYQRNIRKGRWYLYLGAGFNYFDSQRMLRLTGRSHTSFDEFLSLNLVSSLNRSFKDRHYLEFKISYPIIAYLTELTRIPNGLQSGEEEILNGVQLVDLVTTLNYKYKLSDRLLALVIYRFRYYAYNELSELDYGTSQYLFGLSYQFPK